MCFIETVWEAANKVFSNERIEEPAIRVSHVIKGRIPEAIHKPVNQLLESDGSSSNLVVISFLFQLSSSFLILLKVVDMFAF